MEIDFEGLKKYLLGLTAEDIINQVGLKECSCQNEIERQEKRCGKKYIYPVSWRKVQSFDEYCVTITLHTI